MGSFINSNFDGEGASFDAEAYVQGYLFGADFDIATAGAYAAWTDDGLISFTMWMAVFLFDIFSLRQVPYYIINIQYQTQVTLYLFYKRYSNSTNRAHSRAHLESSRGTLALWLCQMHLARVFEKPGRSSAQPTTMVFR